MRPKFSIITPTLNRAAFLREAIESVQRQSYPNVEHIIVDGGSTDGTMELLADYPHLTVIEGPDKGVYDALNKGIAQAGGDVIGLLNSDDLLEAGALGAVASLFEDQSHIEGVFGGAVVFREAPDGARREVVRYNANEHKRLSPFNLTLGVPLTNARFLHRRVYEKVGLFDTQFRIAADRDFLIRLWLARPHCRILDRVVYRYRQHRASMTIQNRSPFRIEKAREYQRIALHYLAQDDAPWELQAHCRAWYMRSCSELALESFRGLRLRDALHHMKEGLRFDPSWPLAFLSYLVCLATGSVPRVLSGQR